MHDIEPHFQWRDNYRAENDQRSPFFGRTYSEFGFSNRVYNYLIHPQWDEFGAETLYAKILFTDYDEHYAIIELIGEWNDAVHNDSMHFKRELIDPLIAEGITKYLILIEGVLNFHADADDYYEEWYQEISDSGGWVAFINAHGHVADELTGARLDNYLHYGGVLNGINWRPQKPRRVYEAVEGLVQDGMRRGVLDISILSAFTPSQLNVDTQLYEYTQYPRYRRLRRLYRQRRPIRRLDRQ